MRYGLIGCGGIGVIRAAALARTPGAKLTWVADADSARAQSLASAFGAAVAPDWRKLVERADVDAVIVSTPPNLHAPIAVGALEAGKHVLVEKPISRDPVEARAMIAAADSARRHLATGFNYRFYPSVRRARELLASGIIGELDHIRSYAGHPGGSEFTHPWVHDPAVMGGGALVDNGIHILDLTRYFLGEVAQVKGYRTGHVWNFEGCEDNAFALLENAAGRVAQLQASWSEWLGYRWRIEIYGTRGCVRASYPPMYAEATWSPKLGDRPQKQRFLFPSFQVQERLKSYRFTVIQSFVEEFRCFARAAAGEKTAAATGLDGARAVEIAHAVYHSSRSGETVCFSG